MIVTKKTEKKGYISLIPPKPSKEETKAMNKPYEPGGPTLWIEVDIPGLSSVAVGGTFEGKIKGTLRSREQSENDDGRKRNSLRIEVTDLAVE